MLYKRKLIHEPEMMHYYLPTETTCLNKFPTVRDTAWPPYKTYAFTFGLTVLSTVKHCCSKSC